LSELFQRADHWFTLKEPVTYWSFWGDLLRLAPVFVGLFAVVAYTVGTEFTFQSFAPIPFVFVAATGGYAVREFSAVGALISLTVAVLYSGVLSLTGTAGLLLYRPNPVLSIVAVLTFIALLAGFASPALHGRQENTEFKQARREYRQDDR
jgi:uncharacterized membrane protein